MNRYVRKYVKLLKVWVRVGGVTLETGWGVWFIISEGCGFSLRAKNCAKIV